LARDKRLRADRGRDCDPNSRKGLAGREEATNAFALHDINASLQRSDRAEPCRSRQLLRVRTLALLWQIYSRRDCCTRAVSGHATAAEQRDEFTSLHCPVASHRASHERIAHFVWWEPAARRDFNPAYDRFGSDSVMPVMSAARPLKRKSICDPLMSRIRTGVSWSLANSAKSPTSPTCRENRNGVEP
jgi:hypothetical protein